MRLKKVQEPLDFVGQDKESKIESVTLELTKQTLTTMLNGLTKIKEQLNSIASS
jgi:hypothetical protein